MFKSLKGDRGSNVCTHTNETEVVVRIFGAEWGTGFEHSRIGQTFREDRLGFLFAEKASNNQL